VTVCPRPLDPIDIEAVAAAAEPVFAADAAAHAAACVPCQALVREAWDRSEALDALSGASEAVPRLVERVTRLRAFSPRERRTYALWKAPLLLDLSLGIAGVAFLALPVLTASEQLTAGALMLNPLMGLARSASLWVDEMIRLTPAGLEALSDGLRRESALGLAALALLAPVALGLRRVLARVPGRK
jgi:hypothetical protein